MKKIKLIEPRHRFPVGIQAVGMPLGLLYLISYLRENIPDVIVELISLRMKDVLGEEISIETIVRDADIVAVTSITSNFDTAIEVLETAKLLGKITVIGGIFPSFNHQWIMSNFPSVDFLIRGDGEIPFAQLVQSIQNGQSFEGIKGLSWRQNGQIFHNENAELFDVNIIPTPAYDALNNMDDYRKISPGSIYSIRGCSFSCKFCSLSPFRENHALFLGIDEVIKELIILKQYGFKRIRIEDETATLNRKRSIQMFEQIANENLGLEFNIKTRVDLVDRELLNILWQAGVRQIKYGIEVPEEASLKNMSKGIHVSEVENALEMTLDIGFKVAGVYVLGWPGVKPEDIELHSKFINKWGNTKNFITMFTFITPHPGTPLWEEAEDLGLKILTRDLSRYTHKQPVAVPESLGADGLHIMVNMYNELAQSTNSVTYNPPIDKQYLAELGLPVSQVRKDINSANDNDQIGDCCT